MLWDRADALKADNDSTANDSLANGNATSPRLFDNADADDNFDLFVGINRTTEIYSRLQKLFCGRKIPRENLASLFGSGADRYSYQFVLGPIQRTLTYFVRGSITVRLTSCLTGYNSAALLVFNLIQIYKFGSIQTCHSVILLFTK